MPQTFSYGRLVAEIALLSTNAQDEADEIRLEAAIRELDSIYAGVVKGIVAGTGAASLPPRYLPEEDTEAIDAVKLLEPLRRHVENMIDEFRKGTREISREAAIRNCQIILSMIPAPTSANESA
ncbi:hypothetical protein [Microvirga sp. Mcv34]|uniref:hypothetical protein n=1 Tax=Microvirga sp. Mcv34 TaxID=2926016 RepID=UPI0021C766D2|nr:hypothetical protein [Microvirga sp. Mcv34]